MSDVFHSGERLVQARAGIRLEGAPIRPFMPDQHRTFFAALPILFVAAADATGHPVATALAGPPGFISSPDETHLHVAAMPAPDDPAAPWLRPGAPAGLLGLEPATRRRNRANGRVVAADAGGWTFAVAESFGNCPKYIVRRQAAPDAHRALPTTELPTLDAAAWAAIAAADTLFVGSRHGERLDMSHRGGPPGFVATGDGRLVVPDYRGNNYYNTLGNLVLDPRVALLVPDFATGDLLSLQGRAEISWGDAGPTAWSVTIDRAWRRPGALPLTWTLATRDGDAAS